MSINVLFTTANPKRHPTFNAPWLPKLGDSVWHYSSEENFSPDIPQLAVEFENEGHFRSKSNVDYSLALKRCLHVSNAPYVLVMEDDAILAESWLPRTLLNLHKNEEEHLANSDQDWLFLRLFAVEKYTGWVSDRIGGNNEFLIAAMIDAVLLILRHFFCRRFHKVEVNGPRMIFITIVAIPSFVVLFFHIGKFNLFCPTPGLRPQMLGYCSQALVFNRRQILPLLSHVIQLGESTAYDLATLGHANRESLQLWANYPMIAQHIGMKTATFTTESDAQAIWSMAYEDFSAEELAQAHRTLREQLYGLGGQVDV